MARVKVRCQTGGDVVRIQPTACVGQELALWRRHRHRRSGPGLWTWEVHLPNHVLRNTCHSLDFTLVGPDRIFLTHERNSVRHCELLRLMGGWGAAWRLHGAPFHHSLFPPRPHFPPRFSFPSCPLWRDVSYTHSSVLSVPRPGTRAGDVPEWGARFWWNLLPISSV